MCAQRTHQTTPSPFLLQNKKGVPDPFGSVSSQLTTVHSLYPASPSDSNHSIQTKTKEIGIISRH
jgi:hypothetical protein